MNRLPVFAAGLLLLQVLSTCASAAEPVRRAYGIERRELWTSGNIDGFPEPPDPQRTQRRQTAKPAPSSLRLRAFA